MAPSIPASPPGRGDPVPSFYVAVLTDPASVQALMAAVSSVTGVDAVLLIPTRWALGFAKTVDDRYLPAADREAMLFSEEAFGYPGLGGSLGFADPRARMSFGYMMNRRGMKLAIDDRCQSLVDAVYRALGYHRIGDGGPWYT